MKKKNTKEKWKRIVASLLVVAMAFTSTSLDCLARDVPNEVHAENDAMATPEEVVAGEKDAVSPHIVAEVDGERSETTKMFRMSDGSYTVAAYDQPVHYENEQGSYEEIDNTFIPDERAVFGVSDDTVYKNKAGRTNIRFREKQNAMAESEVQAMQAEEAESDIADEAFYEEVSMEVGGQVVSWTYEGMSVGQIVWEKPEEDSDLTGDARFLAVPHAVTTGTYEDAFDCTDLQYIISPEGIKENIILKDKKADNIWKIRMDIGSFKAVQTDEQSVELYDATGETVMVIAAPFMTDQDGKISMDVTLSMKQEGSILYLTVTADREFLQDEKTSYPVVVAPYFYLVSKTDISISDTFLSSAKPSTSMRVNGMATGSLVVGKEASTYGKTRSLLKMDALPKLPAGSVITEADLILLNYY